MSSHQFELANDKKHDKKVRDAIKDGADDAKFVRFTDSNTNLKPGSYGFQYQDGLEGSLPTLALFMHRDPYTFASMGLHSNHRHVNPKNFLQEKDDKPAIVDAIKTPGNMSFQTSQVDVSFYKISVRDRANDAEPCLRSLCRFDFKEESSAGKLLLVVLRFVS